MRFFKKKSSNSGLTAIEYSLIISLIAMTAIVGFRRMGNGYVTIYNGIAKGLDSAG